MDYSAFDNLSIGIVVVNTRTDQVIYRNKWVSENTGRNVKDKNLVSHAAYVREQLGGERESLVKQHLEQYGNFKLEYNILVDGKTKWFDLRGSILSKEDTDILCITLTDITEQKQVERDLTHIIQSVPGGLVILTIDEFLTISYANAAYYGMLGYTELEFIKKLDNKAILTLPLEERKLFLTSLRKQIAKNVKFHLEFRLVKKTGRIIHINLEASYARKENQLYCVLSNITTQKEIIYKLNEEMKLNQIIFGLSSDILFNLDLRKKEITFSENVLSTFKLNRKIENFPWGLAEAGIIACEDIQKLICLAEAMYRGEKMISELCINNKKGKAGWYSFEYDFLYDRKHKPFKAVGKITDISGQKKLREKALLDPLTGLFNKTETKNAIEKCILCSLEGQRHAFLIVDIDNFKGVNDTLGHHFGDMVLSDISGKIGRLFTSKDLVGRIGGDEFAIFLRDIKDETEVRTKAEQIAGAFRHTFTGESSKYKISGSIGIAFYPEDGKTYETLYRNADSAMYESKRSGKDRYTFYSSKMSHHISSRTELLEEVRCYEADYYKEHLLYTVFDLLYETKDIYASVNKVLEILGKRFDVDRCYIFETAEESSIFNNTYEWCRDGIEPQIQELQGLTREELEFALCRYNSDGIFVCDDPRDLGDELFRMLDRQGIKSMLHCGVPSRGAIKAIVGFDDCKTIRSWSEGDLTTLVHISRLLGMYLINREISDELRATNQNKNMLIDDMSGYIYVINADTHEVLYMNKSMKELARDAKCGDKCYDVAFNTDKPCDICPCKSLNSDNIYASQEFYVAKFGIWTHATASRVKWIGCKNAVLISCSDITKYKA